MWLRSVAGVAVSAGVLGVSGCANSVHSCGAGDYKPTGQRGFATPRQMLRSALAANPSLSQDGWRAASRALALLSSDPATTAWMS